MALPPEGGAKDFLVLSSDLGLPVSETSFSALFLVGFIVLFVNFWVSLSELYRDVFCFLFFAAGPPDYSFMRSHVKAITALPHQKTVT